MRQLRRFLLVLLLISMALTATTASNAQNSIRPEVGVISGSHDGYALFMPEFATTTYLIDGEGHIVHEWHLQEPAREAQLRENGNLVVSADHVNFLDPNAGFANPDSLFAEYTWDSELVWSYEFERPGYQVHHGVEVLPNGNIMFIAWEYKTREEALAAGHDPSDLEDSLWPDVILEYSPTEDAIVWEWHAWDHLIQDFDASAPNFGVISENPYRIDLNFYEPEGLLVQDWNHSNAVDYNAELDQVLLNPREFNEVWVINHNISTDEAQTEAGDLLFRWGNPRAYGRGDESDRQLSFQHDTQWIPAGYPGAGNLISFSNQHSEDSAIPSGAEVIDSDANYSKIVEFTPPLLEDGTYTLEDGQPFGPTQPIWAYDGLPDHNFYSQLRSGVQRLPNGNTLIFKSTDAVLLEVTPEGEVAWEYIPPFVGQFPVVPDSDGFPIIFRGRSYPTDFAGFEGRDLTPGPRIEDRASLQLEYPAYIVSEQTIGSTLSSDIPERFYVFSASVHQLITVNAQAIEGATAPQLNFLQPEKLELMADLTPEGVAGTTYRITEDGDYIFTVSNEVGEGDFEITFLDQGNLFEDVESDTPRLYGSTTFTSFVTEEDASSTFVFWGRANDVISVSMERGGNALEPVITLADSEQALLVTESDEDNNGKASIEGYSLPYTGVYYVTTSYDENQDPAPIDVDSGSYTFEFASNQ